MEGLICAEIADRGMGTVHRALPVHRRAIICVVC